MTASPSEPIPEPVAAILAAIAGGMRPMLSPAVKRELVELLTRLVAEPDFRDAYCRALTAERVRLGVHRSLIRAGDSGDIPDREIARSGFAALTDEQLVDYAVSPSAVNAIAERLYDDDLLPELGDWLFQAGSRGQGARSGLDTPSPSVLPADANPRHGNGGPGAEMADAGPVTVPHRPTRPPRRWTVAAAAACAASLLLGLSLGALWPGRNPGEVRLASLSVRGEPARGIGTVAVDVRNDSSRRAFVSVVGLIPGRSRPVYHYRSQGQYLDAPPHRVTTVTNLPPEFEGATALVVFLTSVPAGEAVRETPAAGSPDSAEGYAAAVRKALIELGIDSDSKVVSLPAAPR